MKAQLRKGAILKGLLDVTRVQHIRSAADKKYFPIQVETKLSFLGPLETAIFYVPTDFPENLKWELI